MDASLELSIRVSNLKRVSFGRFSSYASVELDGSILGSTEKIKNKINPSYKKRVQLDNTHGQNLNIRILLYRLQGMNNYCKGDSHNNFLGFIEFNLIDVLSKGYNYVLQPLVRSKQPKLACNSEQDLSVKESKRCLIHVDIIRKQKFDPEIGRFVKMNNKVNLQIRAIALRNSRRLSLTTSEFKPFYVIKASRETPNNGRYWVNIYKSEICVGTSNPLWDQCSSIDVELLCGSDFKKEIKFVFYDQRSPKVVKIGEVETTLEKLILAKTKKGNASIDRAFNVRTGGLTREETGRTSTKGYSAVAAKNDGGKIVVLQADVESDESSICLVNSNESSLSLVNSLSIEQNAKRLLEVPPHDDYFLNDGCQIKLFTAIDFSIDNAPLHYFPQQTSHSQTVGLKSNPFQRSIKTIGEFLIQQSLLGNDYAKKFPVLGFGAILDGQERSIFQCGEEEQVSSIQEILNAYEDTFHHPTFQMGSKPSLTDILNYVSSQAIKLFSSNYNVESSPPGSKKKHLAYSLLLILTTGKNLHDMKNTVRALVNAINHAPLSILFVVCESNNNDTSHSSSLLESRSEKDSSSLDHMSSQFYDEITKNNRPRLKILDFSKNFDISKALSDLPKEVAEYFFSEKHLFPVHGRRNKKQHT